MWLIKVSNIVLFEISQLFALICFVGVAQEVWLHLCKLLYQLADSCSIQEEGFMKTAVLQPLPPALEKMLTTLLTTVDTAQYKKVILQLVMY